MRRSERKQLWNMVYAQRAQINHACKQAGITNYFHRTLIQSLPLEAKANFIMLGVVDLLRRSTLL